MPKFVIMAIVLCVGVALTFSFYRASYWKVFKDKGVDDYYAKIFSIIVAGLIVVALLFNIIFNRLQK